jgi:hypothetical protein
VLCTLSALSAMVLSPPVAGPSQPIETYPAPTAVARSKPPTQGRAFTRTLNRGVSVPRELALLLKTAC